jgi:primosomal protein N''
MKAKKSDFHAGDVTYRRRKTVTKQHPRHERRQLTMVKKRNFGLNKIGQDWIQKKCHCQKGVMHSDRRSKCLDSEN